MSSIRMFISNIHKHGIKYAIGLFLLAHDNDVLYDYCYGLDYAEATEDVKDTEGPVIPTACGCSIFTDCTECGSYSYCHMD